MKMIFTLALFNLGLLSLLAQTEKETNLIADGNELHQEEAYSQAEGEYRKALSLNSINLKAQHNLGNSLYRSKDYDQANQRYFETQKNSLKKEDKHLAFHIIKFICHVRPTGIFCNYLICPQVKHYYRS